MTAPCSDLVSFADGELDDERAAAFAAHLATCEACQVGLIEAMQMTARLETLQPPAEHASEASAASDAAVVPGAVVIPGRIARASQQFIDDSSSVSSARGQFGDLAIPARQKPAARKRSKWWIGGGAAGLLVALLAILVVIPPPAPPSPVADASAVNPFAKLTTRPYEIRMAYADASAFRVVREVSRGSNAPAHEEIPPDQVSALKKRDPYGQWIAELWNHHDIADIASHLRKLPSSPAIESDLAAIDSLTTTIDNREQILRKLEELQRNNDPHVARAAKWNYALQLEALDLPRTTAAAFSEIASDHEPGWADDATLRANEATTSAELFERRWQDASAAGEALWRTGTLVPDEAILNARGLMRAYVYHAVRAAPSADRVRALEPMAKALDEPDRPILRDYVRRVAGMSFQRRASLARLYAKALAHEPLTPVEQRSLTTPTPSADVADIVMGGMVELDAVTTHLDAFRALVKASNDPWFQILLAKEAAKSDAQRGDWVRAESRLLAARSDCTASTAYQCLGLYRQLALVEQELHHVSAALKVSRDALGFARIDGEWGHYRDLLFVVADIERFNHSTATARAYAQEFLLMAGEDCVQRAAAYQVIAGAALLDVDGATARRALDKADCRPADLGAANDLADIGRLDRNPDNLAKLRRWLGALRKGTTLTPGQRVLADEIEGRLQIETDLDGGTQLLERAIKEADALPDDVDADKARAAAYSVLIFSAADHQDHRRAFGLVAQTLGLATPSACAVAMNAEDERSVVIVRDASGKDYRVPTPDRRPSVGPLVAASTFAPSLTGCKRVQVLALTSLQGQPDILPRDVAWSYAIDRHRHSSASPDAGMPQRTLIVMNVQPPAELNLPTLRAVPLETKSAVRNVSGREATPSRVLAEMRDATEIQFHTHALVDAGVSDASLLVLSPDPDGHYALTAEAIRNTPLRGHPIVVLAACHSAQGANYQHAAWSLPDAFVVAGARAVFAAGTDIPDLSAGPFFNQVLDDVRKGADPATALRDARMHADPKSWIADVMLFE